jgi:hypothetical protein
MSDRGLWIPETVLRSVRTPNERLAVVDIFWRGADGVAIDAPRRILADEWGMSERKAENLIQRLAENGFIEIESGDRTKARRIRPVIHRSQITDPQTIHSSNGQKAAIRKSDPQMIHSSPITDPHLPTIPKHSKTTAAEVQEVYLHWREYHSQCSKKVTKVAGQKIRIALDQPGVNVADLKLMTDWIHKAPDAGFWQGENDEGKTWLGVETIYKQERLHDRIERSKLWDEEGRPNGKKLNLNGKKVLVDEKALTTWCRKQWKNGGPLAQLVDEIHTERYASGPRYAKMGAWLDEYVKNPPTSIRNRFFEIVEQCIESKYGNESAA